MGSSSAYPGLGAADRADLLAQLIDSGPGPSLAQCTFAGHPGWVISNSAVAREILTSDAVGKARPAHIALRFGGMTGRPSAVDAAKRQVVAAMRKLVADTAGARIHVEGAMRTVAGPILASNLTEVYAAALITQSCGLAPGSVPCDEVRRTTGALWSQIERPASGSDTQDSDGLAALLEAYVATSSGGPLTALRKQGWSVSQITAELRSMVVTSWGSTAAATLSTIALGGDLRHGAALKEAMRLFPPTFMITRLVERELPDLPFAVGDLLLVNIWNLHRNPDVWPDPDRFEPKRWEGSAIGDSFMPFGVGPRSCPAALLVSAYTAAFALVTEPPLGGPARLGFLEGRVPALIPDDLLDSLVLQSDLRAFRPFVLTA